MTRRAFEEWLVAAVALLAAGIVAIPSVLCAVSPALRHRPNRWRPLGLLSEFPPGVHQASIPIDHQAWPRSFRRQSVFVWRRSDEDLVVFSRHCTDLGCPLDFDSGSGCYFCPCHGGIFDSDGHRLAGPPKQSMHRYAHRLRDGILEIDLASIPPA